MMERLNKDKCYKLFIKPKMDIDQYVLPHDWLRRFVELCSPATQMAFEKHIGKQSRYHLKNTLIDTLKCHYVVLNDLLKIDNAPFVFSNDQKTAVISKINEQIGRCTSGFHIRVNSLLENYFSPKTIDELFGAYRYQIVENSANQVTDETHTNNRFFALAEKSGYGVRAKLENDIHQGEIADKYIKKYIKSAFSMHFHPFSFMAYAKTMMLTHFNGYTGRNTSATGYAVETYEAGLDFLKHLLGARQRDYTYLVLNPETSAVCDIRWGLILNQLWAVLLKRKYFIFPENVAGLIKAPFYDENQPNVISMNHIASLCSSEMEGFAYIHCNPALPSHMVIAFLSHLAATNEENIWRFAAEHPKWSHDFADRYFQTYPHKLKQLEDKIKKKTRGLEHLLCMAKPQYLKALLLKLHAVPLMLLSNGLHTLSAFNNTPVSFLLADACDVRVDDLRLFISLLKRFEDESLSALFLQNNHGETLFIRLLKQSHGHFTCVHDLLKLVNTISSTHDKRRILQLHDAADKNGLLAAIEHCPAAVPAIFCHLLTTDIQTQNKWVSACLATPVCHMPKYACIQFLLKLNQKVNTLKEDPRQTMALIAAHKLQDQLVHALADYFAHHDEIDAYQTLQRVWQDALNKASIELAKERDWLIFLANAALVLVSIPLLGLPFLINFYRTGYKRTFFQTKGLNDLDVLAKSVQNKSEFERMWSPESSVVVHV